MGLVHAMEGPKRVLIIVLDEEARVFLDASPCGVKSVYLYLWMTTLPRRPMNEGNGSGSGRQQIPMALDNSAAM